MPTQTNPSNPLFKPVDLGRVVGTSILDTASSIDELRASLLPTAAEIKQAVQRSGAFLSHGDAVQAIVNGLGTSAIIQEGNWQLLSSGAAYRALHPHEGVSAIELTEPRQYSATSADMKLFVTKKTEYSLAITLPSKINGKDPVEGESRTIYFIGIPDPESARVTPAVHATIESSDGTSIFLQGSIPDDANGLHFLCEYTAGHWHVQCAACKKVVNNPIVVTEDGEHEEVTIDPSELCTIVYHYNGCDTPTDGVDTHYNTQFPATRDWLLNSTYWPTLFGEINRIGWKTAGGTTFKGTTFVVPANTFMPGSTIDLYPLWEKECYTRDELTEKGFNCAIWHPSYSLTELNPTAAPTSSVTKNNDFSATYNFLEKARALTNQMFAADSVAMSIEFGMRTPHDCDNQVAYIYSADGASKKVIGWPYEVAEYKGWGNADMKSRCKTLVPNLTTNRLQCRYLEDETYLQMWVNRLYLTKVPMLDNYGSKENPIPILGSLDEYAVIGEVTASADTQSSACIAPFLNPFIKYRLSDDIDVAYFHLRITIKSSNTSSSSGVYIRSMERHAEASKGYQHRLVLADSDIKDSAGKLIYKKSDNMHVGNGHEQTYECWEKVYRYGNLDVKFATTTDTLKIETNAWYHE